MALDMYAMDRCLVFRGCVGPSMMARRGIGAGSATVLPGELEWAWAIAVGSCEAGPPLAECPALAAVVEATKGLKLEWSGPETLRCCSTGQELSLAEGSPAMLKKVLKARWAGSQRDPACCPTAVSH